MTEVSSKERVEGLPSCTPEIMVDTMNPYGHPPPDIMPKGLIMNGNLPT